MSLLSPPEVLAALRDLHTQATEERSHYYTGSVIRMAITEIEHLRKLIISETRRAENAHGEAQRYSLEIERLRRIGKGLRTQVDKFEDENDALAAIVRSYGGTEYEIRQCRKAGE